MQTASPSVANPFSSFARKLLPAALFSAALLIGNTSIASAQTADLRNGGKLVLTNGATSIEGAAGGGLANWAVVAGNGTENGIGVSAHATAIVLPDYQWRSLGFSFGLFDRVELSYARQALDTRAIGEALGIGRNYVLNQDVFGAKLRIAGDLVYGDPWMPQIALGVQHKRSADPAIARAVGAAEVNGTDFYVAASKLVLDKSILANATVRLTKANQTGLLGFGSAQNPDYQLQVETSLAYQLSRQLVLGGEYRSKPDNLGFAQEDDWIDLFAAYAINRNLTVTAAYVDLGSIATSSNQRGAYLSLQAAF